MSASIAAEKIVRNHHGDVPGAGTAPRKVEPGSQSTHTPLQARQVPPLHSSRASAGSTQVGNPQ
ncbi:MAG: hypothetical protein OXE40_11750, partial [Gammaproteobacteria bacterium]|nr:hypothetical protein [Gammaproteobacteria bacterium]